MFTTSFHCSCLFLGMWWSWSKFAFIECEFDFQNSLNANANSGIYILIIPILWVWPAPEWSTPGCQSICIYVWEVGDWTATSDCDVSSRLFTLHYCTVATSDTAAHMGRGAVLYQLTDGPSNDIPVIIPHKEVIALSLCARPLAAAIEPGQLITHPWTLPMSLSLLNITVGAPIMLLRNMDRSR